MGRITALAVSGLAALLMTACTSGGSGGGHQAGRHQAASAAPQEQLPARFVSASPAAGASGVNGAAPITVTYSAPLPASAPLPTLKPAIPGTWRRAGNTAVFTPQAGFPAKTKVTVTVPGAAGAAAATQSFTTGGYSLLRLQQLLAQLGYLPLTWTPATGTASAKPTSSATVPGLGSTPTAAALTSLTARQQMSAAYDPPAGTFTWQPGYPSQLKSFWSQGTDNTLTRGAVTGFEGDHGMQTDGTVGPKLWSAVLAAVAKGELNTHGYSYAVAKEGSPETLTIWHNGKLAEQSLANTGIGVAPTPIGTFPVYEKLTFQIMQGTNPDGTHYADPVKWVSYFSGGSAVHYFNRGSYGWPQSLGCVELPYDKAEQSYALLPYGTLVTVVR